MAKKENKNIHELEIKIEGKKWTDAVDKAFMEKQKTVKVDGFRAGKVPRSVFEKKFGKTRDELISQFNYYKDIGKIRKKTKNIKSDE